jgi:hypothetical protein
MARSARLGQLARTARNMWNVSLDGVRSAAAYWQRHSWLVADPTCDTLAGPDGAQLVDLGIYASWCTNLRTDKSWQMISG